MFVPVPNLPSPSEWGWVQTNNGGWEIKWTELPEASQACHELNARKAAGVNLNVLRLLYNVLLCVYVKDNVTVNEMVHLLVYIYLCKFFN